MQSQNPTTAAWPLNSNRDLIEALAAVSGESHETAARRLLDEERCMGINVRREVLEWKLEPHVWSDQLVEFYKKTKAFLYETAVWNRTPLKQHFRQWIGEHLVNWQKLKGNSKPLRILCFGDGLGFDSEYLAQAGHDVIYFEVSQECQTFARNVFQHNGVNPQVVDQLDNLAPESFDVILSMDVLEHVPHPPDVVESFARWLKPGGRLVTHSPFWLIAPYYSTHLRTNRKYSGSLELFRRFQLQPVDGTFFWDPIVLEKTPEERSLPFAMKVGGLLLWGARYESSLYCWLARVFSRRNPRWSRELALHVEGKQPLK